MWTIVPYCVVRSAGFPASHLGRLRMVRAGAAARSVLATEQAIRELAGTRGWSAAATTRALARLATGAPVRTRDRTETALAARYAAGHRRLAHAAGSERAEVERWLRRFAHTERVREVLALANPGLLRDLDRGRWSDRLRCQTASYVQRLAARNETASFFGPLNYGTIRPDAADQLALHWPDQHRLTARRAYLAAGAADALVRAVAFAGPVAPWLVLRRRSGIPPPAGGVPDRRAGLLAAMDGRTSLRVLAGRLGTGLAELLPVAESLVEAGLATHQLQPPATAADPLLFLVGRLAFLPAAGRDRLLPELAGLLEIRDGFCTDDASGKLARQAAARTTLLRLAAGSGGPGPDRAAGGPDRAAGAADRRRDRLAADRPPLREECAGSLELAIGGVQARRLVTAATPALEFLARVAARRRWLARRWLARRLGPRQVPLEQLAARLGGQPAPDDRELHAALARAVPAGAVEADLAAVDLSDLLAGALGGAICSVDLMIAARDLAAWRRGDYDLVLGDVHDTARLTGLSMQFHPAPESVWASVHLATATTLDGHPVVCVPAGRSAGALPPEPPPCLGGLGGLPGQPDPWRVDLDDLAVASDGERVALRSRALGCEVQLHPGERDDVLQTAFGGLRLRSSGFRLGPHTPRLRVGGAVVQRRCWQLPVAALRALRPRSGAADDAGTLVAAGRVWHRYALPEAVFLTLPGERKPVYATVDSPHLLRAVARRAVRVTGDALASEAYPSPGQLWLSAPDGDPYTSELRCVFARAAADGDHGRPAPAVVLPHADREGAR